MEHLATRAVQTSGAPRMETRRTRPCRADPVPCPERSRGGGWLPTHRGSPYRSQKREQRRVVCRSAPCGRLEVRVL